MSFNIRFWGVRGSIPSPGPETAEVGGNTSCVEVTAGEQRIILDGGTGMRRLGNSMLGKHVDATVLLSHVHWDHIQGIPFFAPIYIPGSNLRFITGNNHASSGLREALHAQMRKPHFPVDMNDLPSHLSFEDVKHKTRVGDVEVSVARANHPDAVYAFRLEHEGRAIVYATDTEHYSCVDQRLVTLARDADVLIYDAQYLPGEYPGRIGWGHSTWEAGVELARAAGVGKLVLFHHDPMRTDGGVAEIEATARGEFRETVAAREGMEIALGARSKNEAA